MFRFNYCQTFYLDKSAVDFASEVALTRVDLFFRSKPPASDNLSGIYKPGCELMLIPVEAGIPVINQIGAYRPTEPTEHGAKFAFYSGGEIARVEWDDIIATLNGSAATTFLLEAPAIVKTNREYAFVCKFDGNENFILWTNKIGELLVGTERTSTQHSSGFQGTLFTRVDNPQGRRTSGSTPDASTANNSALPGTSNENLAGETWDTQYLAGNWNEVQKTALKFKVFAARYAHNGVSLVANTSFRNDPSVTSAVDRYTYVHADEMSAISNNIIRLNAQSEPLEFCAFDRSKSDKRSVFYGEPMYQDIPNYPGGVAAPLTINCYANTTGNVSYNSRIAVANGSFVYANSGTFNGTGGWGSIVEPGDFIVVTSANDAANGYITEIKQVESILSNTTILFKQPFERTMLNATFKLAPVAFVSDIAESFVFGKSKDFLTMYDTTANDICRFTSFSVNSISISNSGSGYSNTDYVKVTGYDDVYDNYPALANVVTDASGNISAVYLSNVGCGFSDESNLTVEILKSTSGNASLTSSDGTNANLTVDIGTNIKSAFTNTYVRECEFVNLPSHRMKPEVTVNNPVGAGFTITHRSLFHGLANSSAPGGLSYFINTSDEQDNTNTFVKIFKGHTLLTNPNKFPVHPSRSNQFGMKFANGASANLAIIGSDFSNAMLMTFDISSNSDYQAVYIDPEIVYSHYSTYIINRNYSNEHTNFGEAWSRQVQTKVNFEQDRTAEDCLVYLTAYRPAGTELKVYGKFLNSEDPEEFDDKIWTEMELIGGVGVYSSIEDSSDFNEYTYGFPAYPNTEITLDGTVEVSKGEATVNGTSTTLKADFTISGGGTGYSNGDIVYASPPAQVAPTTGIYALDPVYDAQGIITTNASGVITSISVSNGGFGWANQSSTSNSVISFSNSTGGSTSGSGANITFTPGLAANDIIKIYSPLFPNTNYTLSVVNSVANDTSLTVKRSFGEISANLTGNVSISTTANTVTGTDTQFQVWFSPGDYVAVWANSSVYETRLVTSVASNTAMQVNENWTIANSVTKYAFVQPSNFVNGSIALDELKIDRLSPPYSHSVYNDAMSANVATYYNIERAKLVGYNTFQIKVVMLSNNQIIVPKVDDIRGVGVSS